MGITNFLELNKRRKCFLQAVFGLVEFLSKGLNNPNVASGRYERQKQKRGRYRITIEQRYEAVEMRKTSEADTLKAGMKTINWAILQSKITKIT